MEDWKLRKLMAHERMLAAALEAEQLKEKAMAELQEEIRLEKYNIEERAVHEKQEATIRETQLVITSLMMDDYRHAFMKYLAAVEEEENWVRYMTCNGLPNPSKLSDMNTFLFSWCMEEDLIDMSNIVEKYAIIIDLLMKFDEVIQLSWAKRDYAQECMTIRQQYRYKLQQWIDMACYTLLRQIERDMVREDARTATYSKISDELSCSIWVLIKWPIALKHITDKEPEPIEVEFKEMEAYMKIPVDIDCYCMAIRILWLKHNHYSDIATSYAMPRLPDEYESMYTMDFYTFCQNEYNAKLKIHEEQVETRQLRLQQKITQLDRLEHPPPPVHVRADKKRKPRKIKDETPEVELEEVEIPPLPLPDEVISQREDESRKAISELLCIESEETEVNLRKYEILGGVYHVDLVYHPPQPKYMGREILLTTLQIPKELKFVSYAKPYEAPPSAPDSERTPEVIELEMKAVEEALDRLILITLKLPGFIIWFEPPLVAHWIPEKKIWSTEGVHDVKYNEEKQTITFRTSRLGIHGLGAFKFINIPFQNWELKPETGRSAGGGIVLSISAAIVQAEFIVREDMVCLRSLAGGISTALDDIIGKYMKLHLLIQSMRDAGCDLFSDRDVYCYVKALPMKHPVTEKHLRECMALLCTAYTFSWSRWNASRDFREIVVQFKELHGCVAKERTNIILLVTPSRTIAVSCTEVSPEFSDEPLYGDVTFYADLYRWALQNAGIKSRLLMRDISFKLVNTVAQLLGHTNVINVSS